MHPLYQRLKELDPDTFEKLIFHLLHERHPLLDIRRVEGKAGDEGIDAFAGVLDGGPVVWQCKSFPNGIGKSQKNQIRESLRRAVNSCKPAYWVLCLSIDMDAASHRWFQHLIASRARDVTIDLLPASEIVEELCYRRSLRDAFFPNAIMDGGTLRAALTGTDNLTTEEVAALTAQNAQAYLDRLQARDARYTYELAHTRDRRPDPQDQLPKGAIARITTPDHSLTVFPRDFAAFFQDPPKFRLQLKGDGIAKAIEHERTGRPTTFLPAEISSFSTDLSFLLPTLAAPTIEVTSIPPAEPVPLRVTFGTTIPITYEYVAFQCTRAGSHEAAFTSTTPLPFRITLIIDKNGSGRLTFDNRTQGHTVRDVHRFLNAIAAGITDASVAFYHLAEDKPFAHAQLLGPPPAWFSTYHAFINDLAQVCDHYQTPLTLPDHMTEEDADALVLLKRLITGVTLDVAHLTLTLVKSHAIAPEIRQGLLEERSYLVEPAAFLWGPVLFGTSINPGPVQYHVARARLRDAQRFAAFMTTAPIGESFDLILEPTGTVTATSLREKELSDDSSLSNPGPVTDNM